MVIDKQSNKERKRSTIWAMNEQWTHKGAQFGNESIDSNFYQIALSLSWYSNIIVRVVIAVCGVPF